MSVAVEAAGENVFFNNKNILKYTIVDLSRHGTEVKGKNNFIFKMNILKYVMNVKSVRRMGNGNIIMLPFVRLDYWEQG